MEVVATGFLDNAFVTASEDQSLRVWNPDGSCKRHLRGHTDWVQICL